MKGTVKIEGLEEVNKKILALIPNSSRSAKIIVAKGAFAIQKSAKYRCPVDTGRLRASIGVDFNGPHSAEIEAKTNYAAYVEFGTRKQKPQPYLYPAVEEVKPKFEKWLEEEFKKLGQNWRN